MNKSGTPSIVVLKANPKALMRLFCFPYAGGASHKFGAWRGQLPAVVEICGVELPGRSARSQEALIVEFDMLVGDIVCELPHWIDKPFAFFGHSLGALLAFESARWLREVGRGGPRHLFVSGHPAPQLPPRAALSDLSDERLKAQLRRWEGTPDALVADGAAMQSILPVLRADLAASETYVYRPGPPLGCPITIFGGKMDYEATAEELAAWRAQTLAGAQVKMFDGGHFFITTAEADVVAVIAAELRRLAAIAALMSHG